MAEMTPADVAAVTHNNGYGNGYGYGAGEWIWIVVLFALFGGGGFGWGNRQGYGLENALTRTDLQQGFDNQTIQNKIDNLSGLVNSVNNGLCDGFYETTKNLLQGQNMLQRDLCQGFSTTNAAIAENRFAAQQCCCETNRNIDAVRYENAKNTCDIVRAIEKDGDETRKLIVANQLQDLRDKLAEKDNLLQSANLTIQNNAQTRTIIDSVKPCPIPAYPACSPYESAFVASNRFGFGYGNGCGCGYGFNY